MSVSVSDFQNYVGTKEDGAFVDSCLNSANLLVSQYIGKAPVPATVRDQATLIVASEMFHRRSAPNGVAQFASMDGNPVRIAKDPMNAAYPILMPFIGQAV